MWLTINIILNLHAALFLGSFGVSVMGIVAIVWTIDCFVGFYLTLPASVGRFWQRWKLAWQVKWRASAFRVNFDLHRASGLWFWPVLLVFACSSVMLNLPAVYHWVADFIFDYRPAAGGMSMSTGEERPPRLDFRAALSIAQRLMAEQAASHGFSVKRPTVFMLNAEDRSYFYNVKSSRDIWDDRDNESFTTLTFDGDTGALRSLNLPTSEHAGNTISNWLQGLHEAWVFGFPYQIFVSVLGLLIAMLSATGVYIWWTKRQGRGLAARKLDSFTQTPAQPKSGTL